MATARVALSLDYVARAKELGVASLHEAAGRRGALPHNIKPLCGTMRLSGPAFTVRSPVGDNLWIHRALAEAQAGDVLVVDAGAGEAFGYWGEVMARAAQARGLAGLVISGGVRDSQQLVALALPTFCASIAVQGTVKNFAGAGALSEPVRIGEVVIASGDLVVGDADGVFAVGVGEAPDVISTAERRESEELAIFDRLIRGELTLDIYQLRNGGERS